MTPPRRPSLERAGFTLVELMVVVLIIGMVAGVAMVSWQAMVPSQQLNSAVRELAARIQGTRSEAIARSAGGVADSDEYRIYYDIDENSYWVETPYAVGGGFVIREVDEEQRLRVYETDLNEGIDLVSVTIDDKEYTSGVVFVRFDALAASSAHTIVLYQEIFERYCTVEVLALTGLIKFHEGIYERPPAEDADFD